MEFWCFITLGFHCMHVPEGYNGQRSIIFSDGDSLRMDVRLEFVPYEYNTYAIKLITSHQNTSTILLHSFLDGHNHIIIRELLLKKYNDSVVQIILSASNGKHVIRDVARLIYSQNSEISNACTKERCAVDLAWWKSYPPADDESTYRYTVASIKKKPHVVFFKNKDLFTVALGFKNTSTKIHHVILIFAYGTENNSHSFIAGFNSEQKLVLNETFDQAYLKIKLCMDEPCSVNKMFPVILLQYDDRRTDQNCLATRCNIILDFGVEESHEYLNNESVGGSVEEIEGGLIPIKFLILCSCVVVVIVLLIFVIIGICHRFKKQVNRNEMAENIRSRPPMDLPPEVEYEEVYSHGAGLQRPRRQRAPGPRSSTRYEYVT